jgi:uncharacterized protein with HEPN domain
MSRHDPRVTLEQLAEHARRIRELAATYTLPVLLNDWKLSAAFEREMEVIGEAVKRLPVDLRQRYPEVPWQQIAGTRDRLSHGYDSTDYNILWEAATRDVPELLATVERILQDLAAD